MKYGWVYFHGDLTVDTAVHTSEVAFDFAEDYLEFPQVQFDEDEKVTLHRIKGAASTRTAILPASYSAEAAEVGIIELNSRGLIFQDAETSDEDVPQTRIPASPLLFVNEATIASPNTDPPFDVQFKGKVITPRFLRFYAFAINTTGRTIENFRAVISGRMLISK